MKKLILILFVFVAVLNAQLYKVVKPESNNLGVKLVRVLEIRESDNAVMVDLLNADSSIAFSNTFFRLDRLPFKLSKYDVYTMAGLGSAEIDSLEMIEAMTGDVETDISALWLLALGVPAAGIEFVRRKLKKRKATKVGN